MRQVLARPLGNRRFAVFHQYGVNGVPLNEPTRARIVDMAAAGSPILQPPVTLPASLQSLGTLPRIVQDASLQPYAFGAPAGPPFASVPLGAGVSLQTVAMGITPFAVTEVNTLADSDRVPPSALFAVRGQLAPTDERNMYVANLRLTDGVVEAPLKVSTQTFALSASPPFCEALPRVQSAGSGAHVVAWTQAKSGAAGCDLVVNGQRVNMGSLSVTSFVVSATGTAVVAAWEERDSTPTSPRVLWSRRDAGSSAWTTPAPIAPQFSPSTAEQQLVAVASGPGSTLAIVWASIGTNNPGGLVSKYVNGAWTTSQGPSAFDARAIAINGSGQGAVLFSNSCAGPDCRELALYRF